MFSCPIFAGCRHVWHLQIATTECPVAGLIKTTTTSYGSYQVKMASTRELLNVF